MTLSQSGTSDRAVNSEAGFTLVEALIAVVILIVGLVAVTNLLLVAGTSNATANNLTSSVAQATRALEDLKQVPFQNLVAQGSLTASTGCCERFSALPGVGRVRTRWLVTPIGVNAFHIAVESESAGVMTGGIRSRASFTTLRTCTGSGCL